MTADSSPAFNHVRTMQARIEQQLVSIARLRQSGKDTSDAERRLELLRHALAEMRIQLGQLSPTERDAKRAGIGAAREAIIGSRKAG
ncbi:MAG: hypothetical protein HC861_09740 [Rhodospirillaceae bacterium]|nr:hypothetical protein [Rhodospirillaceae bacterium]